MTAAIGRVPAWVELGLGTRGLTPEIARDRLAAIATDNPDAARDLADELMSTALHLIADGYPTAAKLAADTLTIVAGAPDDYAAGWLS